MKLIVELDDATPRGQVTAILLALADFAPWVLRGSLESQPRPAPGIICSACLTEACADGRLLCEDARRAGLILRKGRG